MYHLGVRSKRKALKDPRLEMTGWRHSLGTIRGREHQRTQREDVLKEINGFTVADHKQLTHIKDLKNDGTTACGAWIYCGVFPEEDRNRAQEKRLERSARPRLGILLAERLPHHLQPRVCASRWQALERAQEAGLVGIEAKKQWTGLDTPDYEKEMHPTPHPTSGTATAPKLSAEQDRSLCIRTASVGRTSRAA